MSTTQDYDEPWDFDGENWITDVDNKEVLNLDSIHSKNAKRLVACVNACAGMTDPAAEIQAMREAIRNASHFASCILTEAGRQWQATQPLPDIASIEAIAQQIQDELQRFIKP